MKSKLKSFKQFVAESEKEKKMKPYLYFVTYDLVVPNEGSRDYEMLEGILEYSDSEDGIILRGIDVAKSCWLAKSNVADADELKEIIKISFADISDDKIDEDVDTLIVAQVDPRNISPEGPKTKNNASANEIINWLRKPFP